MRAADQCGAIPSAMSDVIVPLSHGSRRELGGSDPHRASAVALDWRSGTLRSDVRCVSHGCCPSGRGPRPPDAGFFARPREGERQDNSQLSRGKSTAARRRSRRRRLRRAAPDAVIAHGATLARGRLWQTRGGARSGISSLSSVCHEPETAGWRRHPRLPRAGCDARDPTDRPEEMSP